MSFHEMSEADKAEYVRKSVLRFLPSTVLGVALGLGGYYSWNYYDETRTRFNIEASAAFTVFVEGDWIEQDFSELDDAQIKRSVEAGQNLIDDFPKHFYADLTRFIMARLFVQQKDYDAAIGLMKQVEAYNHDNYTTSLARYRLAQLHQLKSDDDKAVEYLDKVSVPELEAVTEDLRGDIHLRAYEYEKAWKSWTKALDATDVSSLKDYLSVKIDFVESIPTDVAEEIIRKGLEDQARLKEEAEKKAAEEKAAAEQAAAEQADSEGNAEAAPASEQAGANETAPPAPAEASPEQ